MKRKRRKLKWGRILILLVVVIGVSLGIYFVIKQLSDDNTIIDNNNNNDKVESLEKSYEVSLVMVGDNLIHSSIYKDANKNANYDGYDFKPMYTYIKEIVQNYDLAYYNQETILGGEELGLSDYPPFNSPY